MHQHIPSFLDGPHAMSCTYHRDSDLPCFYGFYTSLDGQQKNPFFFPNNTKFQNKIKEHINKTRIETTEILKTKNESVLWLFSHCRFRARISYANQLIGNGTKIDMFGRCGKKDPCNRNINCLIPIFQKYKFYLAFENSYCFDYITEKTWKSLLYGMVPIVYGAPMESYTFHLPPNSFLHVDNFTNPKQLSEYIEYLENNDDVYLRYHEWRKEYAVLSEKTLNILDCTICKAVIDSQKPKLNNQSSWWTKSQCLPESK